MSKQINIRPTTSVYSTYKNIKYDPWTAIAEFVDNSTQSYYDHKKDLKGISNWDGLNVEIIYDTTTDGERLVIRDNAFGMNFEDFQRAIILDSPPKKATRSEFGMGLKTAACWFGLNWSVESTELGSGIKYKAAVDVEALRLSKEEEIEVDETECDINEHGTTITIWNLNRKIAGRTIGKTKDQLSGMYRVDLRTGDINIYYNGTALSFKDPAVLIEDLPNGKKKEWKKKIDIKVVHKDKTYNVKGFVAIRAEGSVSDAGFTLIRRGRVIIGGYQNTYRPEEIFGKSNSFEYQRLYGELQLNNWKVTQTKDAFDWYDGLEDELIRALKIECSDFIKKAKTYRKPKKIKPGKEIEEIALKYKDAGIIDDIQTSNIKRKVKDEIQKYNEAASQGSSTEEKEESQKSGEEASKIILEGDPGKRISFKLNSKKYVVNFIMKTDNISANWLNIRLSQQVEGEYIAEWNVKHPFFKSYMNDEESLEVMKMFIFAFVLSEIEANEINEDGKVSASAIRLKMNETLKEVMMGEG